MQIPIYLSAAGIGDAVCGLYAACGAAVRGNTVNYFTHHPEWLQRCHHPGVTIEPHREFGVDMNANYEDQLIKSNSRKCWYCDNITRTIGFDYLFTPTAPVDIDRSIHSPDIKESIPHNPNGTVLLVPFCAGQGRTWHESHWLRLAQTCLDAGMSVIAMDNILPRISGMFSQPFGKDVKVFAPDSADAAIDVMLSSQVVVGLDSGMAHVAALHKVPTIAIMSIYPRGLVFSHTDVIGVMPETACSGCRGVYEKGYRKICKSGCSAMLTISPERVFEQIKGVIQDAR